METRWFIIDYRYFSVSVKIDWPNNDLPVEPFIGYTLDISARPIFIVHIVSLWAGLFRCCHFAILCTSFPNSAFNSDIFETDEECIYPAEGYHGAPEFLHTIRAAIVFEARLRAIWISGHVTHWCQLAQLWIYSRTPSPRSFTRSAYRSYERRFGGQ